MTEKSYLDISENYKRIAENIEKAKLKAGRSDEVRIMAVTKTVGARAVNAAVSCGIRLLGENRVQEFLQKRGDYPDDCEVHFIGGLQSNKVRQIIGMVSLIQSVDGVKLAEEINRRAALKNLVADVLTEVNIAGETTKRGVDPGGELDELVGRIRALPNLRLRGIMVIPPFDGGAAYFGRTQKLFEDMKPKAGSGFFDTLSMGMSGDYEDAVLYGSNMVRLGTALFGYR
ncbi:MAG: YggS family pyridoxal phosphate-dependent enzyme [Oscillospiraceae bacterium]|jgi:pyridoxal phosphate enzyme (YggS family)|nr:YggS family pyridoxal phosphate-dependent enzyme [Oscillospiraceae bacterium]